MTTEINIINAALIKLGSDLINSRSQANSKSAKVANQLYDMLRQELLRRHPWNFATKRASLALLTTEPAFEYSYEFQLPADCLRVIRLRDPYQTYKIEGRKILTNDTTCQIIYIADIDDTSLFDPLFSNVLSIYLAYRMASAITGSSQLEQELGSLFTITLRDAKQVDGQEDSATQLITDTWTYDR